MRFPESLRLRIQIWHGLLLAVTLIGLALAAYRYQAADAMRRVDDELREHGRVVRDMFAPPRRLNGSQSLQGGPQEFRPPGLRASVFDWTDKSGFYYAAWRPDGSLQARSNNAPADIAKPPRVPPRGGRNGGGEPFNARRTRGLLREAFMFAPGGECLLVGRSMESEQAALRGYMRWLIAIFSSVLALGLAVGWWITTSAIRPIGFIVSTAKQIALGELSERIPIRQKNSELGRLSAVLNETFSQLEESFARQSRFTADAAHELRTPVSIILTQAQHALTRERDAATYKQTLEACVSAARRLRQLTESLLELTKLDAGVMPLNLEECDLAGMASDSATLLQPLAEERGIVFAGDLAPAHCCADPSRISQILMNLLTNALDHTPDEGCVTLRTSAESGHALFSVSDTGAGIAAQHLPHIFDRFYRTDDSRNRRTGGAGLGLAICTAIADAHGAKLEVASIEGSGSTFTLRIPVH